MTRSQCSIRKVQFEIHAPGNWNLTLGCWSLLFAFVLAAPLGAQTPPAQIPVPAASESKESFVLEPTGLATGAQGAYLRLISNTPAGFTSSSSRVPEIKFGEGATLVVGSFKLLNANEAECRVNLDADAMGICDVSLIFYSVNGTKVLSTQRATLGLLGPTKLAGIDVSVESVPVVRVNVTDAQPAGVIVLSGPVNGVVTMAAPTGTRFSKAPVATTSKGTINTPALAESNTQFSFSVGNAAREDAVVRITEISYDTTLYTTTGGVLGALNCQIGGAALGGGSTLVANAHTALTTIAGSNDNTDTAAPGSGTQGSGSTNTGGTGTNTSGTSVNNPTSSNRNTSDTRDNTNRNRNNQPDNSRTPARAVNGPAVQGGSGNSGGQVPPNAPREVPAPQPSYQPPTDRREPPVNPARPAGGASAPAASDGSAGFSKNVPGEERTSTSVEEPAPVLITTPGIYFCDKDFKPLDLVVLNSTISDKAGSRVWICVKLKADKTPEIDTIEVTLRVCGVSRTLKLTETGKTTGEFRCDTAGVLLVSSEDPDSSVTEETIVEPKARPSSWSK